MATLSELREQRRELTRQIESLESEERKLKEEEERQVRDVALKEKYVKVVCPICDGRGLVSKGGADILSDPPYDDACSHCDMRGFLYGRIFDQLRGDGYDMDYNEVYTF